MTMTRNVVDIKMTNGVDGEVREGIRLGVIVSSQLMIRAETIRRQEEVVMMVDLIVTRGEGHVNHHDAEMTDIVDDHPDIMVVQVLVQMEAMNIVNENTAKLRKIRNDG